MKTVLLVLQNEKGETLFLLRKKKPFGWALPGGKVNDDDISDIDALIREVKEKTKILLEKENMIFSHSDKSITGDDVDIYRVKLDHTPNVVIDKNEHLNKRWIVSYNEIVLAGNTKLFLENCI